MKEAQAAVNGCQPAGDLLEMVASRGGGGFDFRVESATADRNPTTGEMLVIAMS